MGNRKETRGDLGRSVHGVKPGRENEPSAIAGQRGGGRAASPSSGSPQRDLPQLEALPRRQCTGGTERERERDGSH